MSIICFTLVDDVVPLFQAFATKTDRNLKNCDDKELLHHLHEKRLRHERCLRSQSIYAPSMPVSRQPSVTNTGSESMGDLKGSVVYITDNY